MQGKRIVLTAISTLAMLSLGDMAFATMSLPCGWYLEGNVGTTKVNGQTFPSMASTTTGRLGGNANLGYKFMPYFTAEIGYTYYAETTIKDQFGATAGTNRYYSYDLAFKGILPFVDSGVEAFGKAGVERITSRISLSNSVAATNIGLTGGNSSATGVYLGAGLQYYWVPEFAVVAQWQRAQGSSATGTLDLYSIGLSFLFE